MEESNWNPKREARLAGCLYVIGIALGLFAEVYVRGGLIAWTDAGETAAMITSAAQLYRLGFAAGVLILMINIPLSVFFYRLFRRASHGPALIIAFAILVGTSIEGANLLNHYMPIVWLSESAYLQDLAAESREVLALANLRLFAVGYAVALAFFALYDLAVGYAALKTRYVPAWVGILMIIAGCCYLTNSFALFAAPHLSGQLYPWILLPCFVGELMLALWLLVRGVDVERWRAHASTSPALQHASA